MKMLDVRRIVKLIERAAHAAVLIERLERSSFHTGIELGWAGAAFGDDVDDAADGVRTIQSALRTAQNFDLLNILGQELSEIECAARVAGIADIDAVDQHLGVIGIRATHEHRSL